MSVGKTADNGNVSIFTKEGVTIYKEEDVLITSQRKPILVSKRDERGWYRIPSTQAQGQWQPHKPTNKSKKYLQQANSVYDLTSTEESIKWMHAVCGTYDSRVDGHFLSEKDRKKFGLPILCVSAMEVGVANGRECHCKYVTKLPFLQLSNKAAEADTFK